MSDQEIKCLKNELNKFFNSPIRGYSKDTKYTVDYINKDKSLIKRSIVLQPFTKYHVKQRTTRKVQFLFFSSFLQILTKFTFWEEDWALDYNSMKL